MTLARALCLVAVAVSVCALGSAREAAAQGITAEQVDAILRELREIRELLQRHVGTGDARPAVARVAIARGTPSLGRDDAPLTVVEFTDIECPYCRQFHATTFPEIKRQFVDTGKVRFVSHDFPLDFHRHAASAAHAVRCAGDQGRYWEMRHRVMTHDALDEAALGDLASGLGLALDQFRACQQSGKHRAAIAQDIAEALGIGVSGTPTFVIGRTTPAGVEGEQVTGALPFEAFAAKLQALLDGRTR